MAAEVVWAETALSKLRVILQRISADRPQTARRVVDRLFDRAEGVGYRVGVRRHLAVAVGSASAPCTAYQAQITKPLTSMPLVRPASRCSWMTTRLDSA